MSFMSPQEKLFDENQSIFKYIHEQIGLKKTFIDSILQRIILN